MAKRKIHDYYEGMEFPDYEFREFPKAVKHPTTGEEFAAETAAHEAEIRSGFPKAVAKIESKPGT